MRQAMEQILELAKQKGLNYQLKIADIARTAIDADNVERNKLQWDRINNDVNGNPRYVVHFTQCKPNSNYSYEEVCKLMNKIGGRKYHNKSYGGGIVFQSYSLDNTERDIQELKAKYA